MLLKLSFRYTQRALTQQSLSKQLMKGLHKKSVDEIMHQLYLFEANATIFDYDYYNEASFGLIEQQGKMHISEIYTVLKLGQRHSIQNEMIWQHFSSEFHRRLHQSMGVLIENEQAMDKSHVDAIMQELEANSQDYFSLLKDEFLEELKQEQQRQQKKQEQKVSQKKQQNKEIELKKPKGVNKILPYAGQFVELLIWGGNKNLPLLTLLLESLIHPLSNSTSPIGVLRVAHLLTYTCQIMMQEYKSNPKNYLGRSIKHIYLFQSAYLPELIKHLEPALPTFENSQLEEFSNVLLVFPIKKRAYRKKLAHALGEEFLSRGMNENAEKMEGILGRDQKLKQQYHQLLTTTGLVEKNQQ